MAVEHEVRITNEGWGLAGQDRAALALVDDGLTTAIQEGQALLIPNLIRWRSGGW